MNTLFEAEEERDTHIKTFAETVAKYKRQFGPNLEEDVAQDDVPEAEPLGRGDRDPDRDSDREVTLNSATLLGIFFGLVLVCAFCFGLGFTLGKREFRRHISTLFGINQSGYEQRRINGT